MTLDQLRPIEIDEAIEIFYDNPEGYVTTVRNGKWCTKNAVYRVIFGCIPVVVDLSEYSIKDFISLLHCTQLYTQDKEKIDDNNE